MYLRDWEDEEIYILFQEDWEIGSTLEETLVLRKWFCAVKYGSMWQTEWILFGARCFCDSCVAFSIVQLFNTLECGTMELWRALISLAGCVCGAIPAGVQLLAQNIIRLRWWQLHRGIQLYYKHYISTYRQEVFFHSLVWEMVIFL